MIGHDKIQKGSVVQFKSDWDKIPTLYNTALVTRVAKDRSWADVTSKYGSKRIPDPDQHLKLVKEPIVIPIQEVTHERTNR